LPVVTGVATRRTLRAAAAFVPRAVPLGTESEGTSDLEDRKTIHLGPFAITPFLVDHSAFDAYAMLIEANGRRLFYSGDIRAHERKAALFERLVSNPPRPVHVMLMEGSSLGRLGPGQLFPTEGEIEKRLVERFRPAGLVGICSSAQNIDRVVSIHRACKRTGRTFVLDLYALEVLAATRTRISRRPGGPILPSMFPNISGATSSARSALMSLTVTSRIGSIARR
jgi:ribonuclease J